MGKLKIASPLPRDPRPQTLDPRSKRKKNIEKKSFTVLRNESTGMIRRYVPDGSDNNNYNYNSLGFREIFYCVYLVFHIVEGSEVYEAIDIFEYCVYSHVQ